VIDTDYLSRYLQSGIGNIVILTQPAPKDSLHDCYSRVFAPDIGVPEDPVVRIHLQLVSTALHTDPNRNQSTDWSGSHSSRTFLAFVSLALPPAPIGFDQGDIYSASEAGQSTRWRDHCHFRQGEEASGTERMGKRDDEGRDFAVGVDLPFVEISRILAGEDADSE